MEKENKIAAIVFSVMLISMIFLGGHLLYGVGLACAIVLITYLYKKKYLNHNLYKAIGSQKIAVFVLFMYLFYMLVSVFWSDIGNRMIIFDYAGKMINIVIFVFLSFSLFYSLPGSVGRAMSIFGLVVACLALYSISIYYVGGGFDHQRLYMLAKGENQVVAGIQLGVAGLMLIIGRELEQEYSGRKFAPTLLAAVALAIIFAALLLTKSRGPILAASVAVVTYLLCARQVGRRTIVLSAAAVGALVTAAISLGVFSFSDLLARGMSYRLEIWRETIGLWSENPWFGVGWATKVAMIMHDGVVIKFPHNIFMSTLLFGGVVGVLLLGLIFIMYIKNLYLNPKIRIIGAPFLMFVILVGMFDRQIDLRNFSPEYLYFWLPFAVLMAAPHQKQDV